MNRLAIALSTLLSLNLLTLALRWLIAQQLVSPATLWTLILIGAGIGVLLYLSTPQAIAFDERQWRIYSACGITGVLLGLL
ncbi:hypothetical protein ACQ4M4_25480 [Leptolyngbya sp. AN02str]|uniref:hypothetical protein n=1 Tax=Leptolyngbya sp. AN02str TaxID=3423363 RepID=UPI003D31072D